MTPSPTPVQPAKRNRGFGVLIRHNPDRVREIASQGGIAAHSLGVAYKFSREKAIEAAQKSAQARRAASTPKPAKVRKPLQKEVFAQQIREAFPDLDGVLMTRRYLSQRGGAKARGIGWEFDPVSWCRVWVESGKLAQRGADPSQYVMARTGDLGPYSPTNVYIATGRKNASDASRHPDGKLFARIGTGKGWTYRADRVFRYEVSFLARFIGAFATPEEAKAAYVAAAEAHKEKLRAEFYSNNPPSKHSSTVPEVSAQTNSSVCGNSPTNSVSGLTAYLRDLALVDDSQEFFSAMGRIHYRRLPVSASAPSCA